MDASLEVTGFATLLIETEHRFDVGRSRWLAESPSRERRHDFSGAQGLLIGGLRIAHENLFPTWGFTDSRRIERSADNHIVDSPRNAIHRIDIVHAGAGRSPSVYESESQSVRSSLDGDAEAPRISDGDFLAVDRDIEGRRCVCSAASSAEPIAPSPTNPPPPRPPAAAAMPLAVTANSYSPSSGNVVLYQHTASCSKRQAFDVTVLR